jgi:hypothetical protein
MVSDDLVHVAVKPEARGMTGAILAAVVLGVAVWALAIWKLAEIVVHI